METDLLSQPEENEKFVKRVDYRRNPHLRQNREGFRKIPLEKLKRILEDDALRKEYKTIPHNKRSVNHWGQRKLLLSEIEFLTLFGEEGSLVVYAGAAPGNHIPYLSKLFPNIKFLLVDPSSFNITSTSTIEIKQDFFTKDTVKELKERKEKIFFISDIRTADPKVLDVEQVEEAVLKDMIMQMEWVIELKPAASMLKFRLPWGKGTTDYLNGDIYLPVWGPQTTTETRLIVTDISYKTYEHSKYEQQMFYFNTVTRVQYYEHKISALGIDHCYDCAAEIYLLMKYLRKIYPDISTSDLEWKASRMSEEMSFEISPHSLRTLESRVPVYTRKSWFSGRTFDPENKLLVDLGKIDVSQQLCRDETIELKPRSYRLKTNEEYAVTEIEQDQSTSSHKRKGETEEVERIVKPKSS